MFYVVIADFIEQGTGELVKPGPSGELMFFRPRTREQAERLQKAGCLRVAQQEEEAKAKLELEPGGFALGLSHPEAEPPAVVADPHKETLAAFNVPELKQMAKDANVDGFNAMNKAQLVDALAEIEKVKEAQAPVV